MANYMPDVTCDGKLDILDIMGMVNAMQFYGPNVTLEDAATQMLQAWLANRGK